MDRGRVKLWIEALRSGAYEQARGALRLDAPDGGTTYCCLGVACEVYREATGNGRWLRTRSNSARFEFWIGEGVGTPGGDEGYSVMPLLVAKWYDLRSPDPALGGEWATTLNDHQKKSFSEIADAIETTLEGS